MKKTCSQFLFLDTGVLMLCALVATLWSRWTSMLLERAISINKVDSSALKTDTAVVANEESVEEHSMLSYANSYNLVFWRIMIMMMMNDIWNLVDILWETIVWNKTVESTWIKSEHGTVKWAFSSVRPDYLKKGKVGEVFCCWLFIS